MLIISHRGYWGQNVNKNTKDAFKRSFNLGFGTETDIRDHDGTLVISHDPADSDSLLANLFFEGYVVLTSINDFNALCSSYPLIHSHGFETASLVTRAPRRRRPPPRPRRPPSQALEPRRLLGEGLGGRGRGSF